MVYMVKSGYNPSHHGAPTHAKTRRVENENGRCCKQRPEVFDDKHTNAPKVSKIDVKNSPYSGIKMLLNTKLSP